MNPDLVLDTLDLSLAITEFQIVNQVPFIYPFYNLSPGSVYITLVTLNKERRLVIDVKNSCADLEFFGDGITRREIYRLPDDSDEVGIGEISFQELMEKFFEGYYSPGAGNDT